jgi:hypothetical protein
VFASNAEREGGTGVRVILRNRSLLHAMHTSSDRNSRRSRGRDTVIVPTRAVVGAERIRVSAFVLSILLDDLSDRTDVTRAHLAVAEAARALKAAGVHVQRADTRQVDRRAEAAAAAR